MSLYTLALLVALAFVVGPVGAIGFWVCWTVAGRVLDRVDPDDESGR